MKEYTQHSTSYTVDAQKCSAYPLPQPPTTTKLWNGMGNEFLQQPALLKGAGPGIRNLREALVGVSPWWVISSQRVSVPGCWFPQTPVAAVSSVSASILCVALSEREPGPGCILSLQLIYPKSQSLNIVDVSAYSCSHDALQAVFLQMVFH